MSVGQGVRALLLGGVLVASATVCASCAIDTNPGLALTVPSATVTASGTGTAATLAIDAVVDVHEGSHAAGERMYAVSQADVFVGDHVVGTVNFETPTGFTGRISPGADQHFTFHGVTPAGAFDVSPLCSPAVSTALVLVHWQDRTMSMLGMVQNDHAHVACE